MPYIKQERRDELPWPYIAPRTPGELNYMLTQLVQSYLRLAGSNYQTYNDAVGALECCKLELYRRLVVPYEDDKIRDNGDVY